MATSGTWQFASLNGMAYEVLLPDNYDPTQKYPVLMFLHGGGQETSLLSLINPWFNTPDFRSDYPAIVVAPIIQGSNIGNDWGGYPNGGTANESKAIAIVQQVISQYSSDPNRVYVTGLSLGGHGSWDMMIKYNAYDGLQGRIFAAALPIAGFEAAPGYSNLLSNGFSSNPTQAVIDELRNVPIWAIEGSGDDPEFDEAMAAAEGTNSAYRYTERGGYGHDVWDTTYPLYYGKPYYDWLFSQSDSLVPPPATAVASAPVSTIKRWSGGTGSFNDASSWSPQSAPVSGNTAIITTGTVSLPLSPSGITMQLIEAASSTSATTLNIANATLDSSNTLIVSSENSFAATAPAIGITGTVVLAGTESFFGSKVNFTFDAGAMLVNNGTLNFFTSSPVTNSGGTIQNSGTIALVNPTAQQQSAVFATGLTGAGTIALGANAQVDFESSVAASQIILLNDGTAGRQTVEIDTPLGFAATISGFSSGDSILIRNTPYTGATYTITGTNAGVLNLYSGATLEGSLNFSGTYALTNFSFSNTANGSGQSPLRITTNVSNAQVGGLPIGFQNGSGGGASFRFFDTRDGTHFFTADANEAASLVQNRPDLVEEINNFGSVAQSDPNATAIYRFFDTVHGTHFFTASATEAQTIQQTRPDLTYEPNSTFYEHATQQAGDVAVYRLFDTTLGTHFYTGSQAEFAGLTTQGSGTYRPDLTYEGVGFYAPAGSYFA